MKKNIIYYIATIFVFTMAFSMNVYAVCPLGPDVTKDLAGALKIIKILAPILAIVFSTIDAVKALTTGDGAAEMKKVAIRFGKRCIFALILFSLPVLVDQFMQMADVWDANGTCQFDKPEDNGATPDSNKANTNNKNNNKNNNKKDSSNNKKKENKKKNTENKKVNDATKDECSQKKHSQHCSSLPVDICDIESGCYYDLKCGCLSSN